MKTMLRLLVTGVLALALPIQGLAAAAKWHCAGSAGHHPTFASAGDRALTGLPQHEGEACPHAAAENADGAVAVSDGAHDHHAAAPSEAMDKAAEPLSAKAHTCSACAVCCIGLALPVVITDVAVAQGCTDAPLGVDAPVVSFIVDGAERPPRTDLA